MAPTTTTDDAPSRPALVAAQGAAGRQRAQDHVSWDVIGRRTVEVYADAR